MSAETKLWDELAAASKDWIAAADDIGRRAASQRSIKAFLDWSYTRALPHRHALPLVKLVGYLQDINEGRQPTFFKPSQVSERGNPGRGITETVALATACAAVDTLLKHPHQSVHQIETDVARTIGIDVGRLRSWRKSLKSNRKGPQARHFYDLMMTEVFIGLKPKQVLETLKKNDWRSL